MSLSFPDLEPLEEMLPPEEALAYFEGLVPRMAVSPTFAEHHRRRSFTMAHKSDRAMLERVQGKIAEFVEQGQTRGDVVKNIDEILDAAGVTQSNPQYSEMVFRTNAMDSYNQGVTAELQDPDMAEAFPVWEYLGINDGRQGPDHEPHFGKFFRNNVPFAEVRDSLVAVSQNGETVVRPRAHGQQGRIFNCRCGQRIVSKWEWAEMQEHGAQVEPWPARHAESFAEGSGKPCGEGYISADKECRIGAGKQSPSTTKRRKEKKPETERPEPVPTNRLLYERMLDDIRSTGGSPEFLARMDGIYRKRYGVGPPESEGAPPSEPPPSREIKPSAKRETNLKSKQHQEILATITNDLASSEISEPKRQKYKKAVESAMATFSPEAVTRIQGNLSRTVFVENNAAVADHLRAIGSPVKAGTVVSGFYSLGNKDIVMDGGKEVFSRKDKGWVAKNPAQTYVHEYAHALDGPEQRFSLSARWLLAWKGEINRPIKSLSKYAATRPSEGFSEFARLLMTDSDRARKDFPKCYRFWKGEGLI